MRVKVTGTVMLLRVHDRVIGVMDLESERLAYFTEEHVRMLSLLAPQVAIAVENARLWDPYETLRNFQSFQSLQTFYKFSDVDVDRYPIGGKTTQVMVSARELNRADLPSQSWVNRQLVYTHGFGAVGSAANKATADGTPQYLLKDIPPTGDVELLRRAYEFAAEQHHRQDADQANDAEAEIGPHRPHHPVGGHQQEERGARRTLRCRRCRAFLPAAIGWSWALTCTTTPARTASSTWLR